jgi:hypothetical protein
MGMGKVARKYHAPALSRILGRKESNRRMGGKLPHITNKNKNIFACFPCLEK